MASRRRPPRILTIPANAVNERSPTPSPPPNKDMSSFDSFIKQLKDAMADVDITDEQRARMNEFFNQKALLGGEMCPDDFETITDLGCGNSGVVTKVMHRESGIIMARKLIHLELKPAIMYRIMQELTVLHKCNSPYIVGFYGVFFSNSQISLCMEYMDGGSLDLILKKVGRIPEPILGKITVAVLEGLKYLRYQQQVLHRDVKPSNLLVNTRGEIKMCDFGVSGELINSKASSFVGTRSYMSPERLLGSGYNIRSDIWSLGMSLIEMAIGQYPIPPPDPAQMRENKDTTLTAGDEEHDHQPEPVQNNSHPRPLAIFELLNYIVNEPPPTLPSEDNFSDAFRDFVCKCLVKEPKDRSDIAELEAHEFITSSRDADVNLAEFIISTVGREDTN